MSIRTWPSSEKKNLPHFWTTTFVFISIYDWIHTRADPRMQYLSSLCSNIWWSRLSNALDSSKKISKEILRKCPPLEMIINRITDSIIDSHQGSFLHKNCYVITNFFPDFKWIEWISLVLVDHTESAILNGLIRVNVS